MTINSQHNRHVEPNYGCMGFVVVACTMLLVLGLLMTYFFKH